MSGPTTAIYVADPITVLLAATAIRAGQAIAEGYANAEQLRDEQQGQRDAVRAELKAAAAKGRAALQQELKAAEAEFAALAAVASTLVATSGWAQHFPISAAQKQTAKEVAQKGVKRGHGV